ncbi:PREDICTED: protein disulfide-isomerase 5-2 [Tarenaya hassleriana]|uniref:protein disulfide-isomerase 5-2 n=1 Tax=Tarenaya hassleriana TaxID=28532 RepID=UPI00053C6D18|nr:PREDICTED: protein disulfide-isomerase 5-2 [Tarenaya hassleriana]
MRSLGLGLGFWISLLAFPISLSDSSSSSSSADQLTVDGTVLQLTESNFDSAISSFDFIFVDFYAPWCGHCKRLSPELDAAAPILAKLKQPIVIAKLDAERYSRLARKLDIDAFPTLKLYNHGVPMEYYGPRKADLLVRYLKKFVAPDVAVLESDSAVKDFVEDAGTFFPLFLGFGLNETVMSTLGAKYKKKAWFAVAKDASEDVMVSYDFDKVPALVAKHPKYNERSVFYGPFEDGFLEQFVKQNFLPLTVPINRDTLKLLKEDERKIVLAIVEDETHESSGKLIKALRAAANANRDMVFGYVGVEQFDDFADSFHADKKSKLPKIVVWDGDEEYHQVIGVETIEEEDHLTQISRFLEGYREGRTEKKGIKGPTLMGFINSMIGIKTVYIVVFLVAVLMIIRSLGQEDEPPRPRVRATTSASREPTDQTGVAEGESSELKPRDKED